MAIMDVLKRKTHEGQSPKTSEQPPQPTNELEKLIQNAPPVVTEQAKSAEQLRQEALHTMALMEAAREEKGNFCITLGRGDERAVLLAAPVEGVRDSWLTQDPYTRTESLINRVVRTDYVVLTANGPRRVSFITEGESEGYLQNERQEQQRLQEYIGLATSSKDPNGVNLPDSSFRSGVHKDGTTFFMLEVNKPGYVYDSRTHDQNRLYRTRDLRPNQAREGSTFDVATEATAGQALKNSLAKIQSPIQAQIDSARSQIYTTKTIAQGLK